MNRFELIVFHSPVSVAIVGDVTAGDFSLVDVPDLAALNKLGTKDDFIGVAGFLLGEPYIALAKEPKPKDARVLARVLLAYSAERLLKKQKPEVSRCIH